MADTDQSQASTGAMALDPENLWVREEHSLNDFFICPI